MVLPAQNTRELHSMHATKACSFPRLVCLSLYQDIVIYDVPSSASPAHLWVLPPDKKVYNGSRWQPNKPLPPQFRLGVSCIWTVSAAPPEALGLSAFTVIGNCQTLAHTSLIDDVFHLSAALCLLCSRGFFCPQCCAQDRWEDVVADSSKGDNSLLHFVRPLPPPCSVCRGLSSPPTRTSLWYLQPSNQLSLLGCRAQRYSLSQRELLMWLDQCWLLGQLGKHLSPGSEQLVVPVLRGAREVQLLFDS